MSFRFNKLFNMKMLCWSFPLLNTCSRSILGSTRPLKESKRSYIQHPTSPVPKVSTRSLRKKYSFLKKVLILPSFYKDRKNSMFSDTLNNLKIVSCEAQKFLRHTNFLLLNILMHSLPKPKLRNNVFLMVASISSLSTTGQGLSSTIFVAPRMKTDGKGALPMLNFFL